MPRTRTKALKKQVLKNRRAIRKLAAATEYKHYEQTGQFQIKVDSPYLLYFNNTLLRDEDDTTIMGGVSSRNGDKVQNKSLFIRAYFDNRVGVTAPEDILVRCIIGKMKVKDKDVTAIDMEDLLVDEDDINSLYKITDENNYDIYFDHTFSMDHVNYQQIPFKFKKKLKDQTEYIGQATTSVATVTNMVKNVYFMSLFSTASEEVDSPYFRYSFRFGYTDA